MESGMNIPDDILMIIFQNLCIGDRFRIKAVCKLWKHILQKHDHLIPQALEAPWEILSNDSYSSPQPLLSEICFKSMSENERIYRFKLPKGLGGGRERLFWYCGSSRGWLLVATGRHNWNPYMWLWDPISGTTRKLPSLTNHPSFQFHANVIRWRDLLDNISTIITRVEVFSIGSVECIVCVLVRADHGRNLIAVCSPLENRWTVFGGGGGAGERVFYYTDILFHNKRGLLCALAVIKDDDNNVKNSPPEGVLQTLYLPGSGSEVNLWTAVLNKSDYTGVFHADHFSHETGFRVIERSGYVLRFVEDSIIDGNIVILIVSLDCLVGARRLFQCCQTAHMSTIKVVVGHKPSKLTSSTTIGDQAIFLSSTGSFSLPCPARGAKPDCVYFAVHHARGFIDGKSYMVREHGIFFMKTNLMQRTSFKNVRWPLRSNIGWFAPKLFR